MRLLVLAPAANATSERLFTALIRFKRIAGVGAGKGN